MAGWRHSPPQRVRARQRGAARKSPGRLPFFSRPRRSDAAVAGVGAGEVERWSPCPAEIDSRGDAELMAARLIRDLWTLSIAASRKFLIRCIEHLWYKCREPSSFLLLAYIPKEEYYS
jgi:hypothetical protein